jgi:hypothetical protein
LGHVVIGVHPHWPVVPPPPHVFGKVQVPPLQHGSPLAPHAMQVLPLQI